MTSNELWTIGQLSEQAAAALGTGDSVHAQASGRVREVPDPRTIRWYQTTGLVDRPAAMRGRTALYGRRHLLQLLAIKRLQAQGKPLIEIQAEIAGAPDATLVTLAGLPSAFTSEAAGSLEIAGSVGTSASVDVATSVEASAPQQRRVAAALSRRDAGGNRFWATEPAADSPAPNNPVAEAPGELASATVCGVRVDAALTVLIDGTTRQLDTDDVEALRRAARPVVETLRRRGLVMPQPTPIPNAIPEESS